MSEKRCKDCHFYIRSGKRRGAVTIKHPLGWPEDR